MKIVVLVRHAKSSWEHDIADIDRPLSARGHADANLLSNEFLKFNFSPDAVFSSPANRAMSTCRIFMETCKYPSELLETVPELYDFGGGQVVEFVRNMDDSLTSVMIFGHNHAFTAIANRFGHLPIGNVPTCGLVMLQFDIASWKNIDKGHTKMTLFPKELKA